MLKINTNRKKQANLTCKMNAKKPNAFYPPDVLVQAPWSLLGTACQLVVIESAARLWHGNSILIMVKY